MYREMRQSEVPKRQRKSKSRFEATLDWQNMKSRIDRGIARGGACSTSLSPADWRRMGLSAAPQDGRNTATGTKSVCRFIKRYLAKSGKPYTVTTKHIDGLDHIFVYGPPDATKKNKRKSRPAAKR